MCASLHTYTSHTSHTFFFHLFFLLHSFQLMVYLSTPRPSISFSLSLTRTRTRTRTANVPISGNKVVGWAVCLLYLEQMSVWAAAVLGAHFTGLCTTTAGPTSSLSVPQTNTHTHAHTYTLSLTQTCARSNTKTHSDSPENGPTQMALLCSCKHKIG